MMIPMNRQTGIEREREREGQRERERERDTNKQAKPEAMTQPMPTSLSETADMITPVVCDVDDGYFDAILGVVVIRYMYRHKGTYHTNEAKGTEFAETADAALRGDPALQDAMDESKKEYFI
ncbi:glycophorin-C-like isoform X2 [Oncorhynchus masou masou]|uniref:glycophorin-C-like isoform X2 n=1 Tax=Oncorhynchus masou masou TaxID=90313 RepID=UPI0031844200